MNADAPCATCLPVEAEPEGELAAWKRLEADAGSIASLRIFSGVLAATSSISMPPSVDAITATRAVPRSTTHAEVELARDVAALLDEHALRPACPRGRSGA